MKILYISVVMVIGFLTLGYIYFETKEVLEPQKQILSFQDCVNEGYIVMESYPRQCKTPDGRTFAEEVKVLANYQNATSDLIQVDLPYPGAVVGKSFSVIGKARGNWYFEASFPVKVLDKNGSVLYQGPAQAETDWMTTDFVSFKLDLTVPENYIGPAELVLMKDNPSGDAVYDASLTIPITIEY